MQGERVGGARGTRVTPVGDRAAIAEEWDDLARRTGAAPFLRPGWVTAWHAAFGPEGAELLAARRGETLAGVLPLRRVRGALVSPTNWHSPEFGPVAADDEAAAALVAAALQRARTRVDLSFLPRAGTAERLRAQVTGSPAIVRVIERSPWVDLSGDWEAYEASLPARRRADLRRRRRRLEEEAGEVSCAHHGGDENLAALLAEGFAVEASGWKGERGTAINADASVRGFYESVAKWAAGAGILSLWFLRAGERTAAFAFCIADEEAHYVLKIGFDPAFSRYAPGMLLTREMLRAAFKAGRSRYEFLGQDDDYKLVWTDRLHERERLQVFRRGAAGALDRVAWKHGRPLAKRLLRR